MKIISKQGREDLAYVYIAESGKDRLVEFVESVEPPIPRDEKWVNIVSTMYGCPVNCPICDAGNYYSGKLTADEILWQIDYLVQNRYPDHKIPAQKWKIQFARMGDPAFNPAVLEALEILPGSYDAPGLMPCVSTIAPRSSGDFFERLIDLKERLYPESFQFQFSLHTTDEGFRAKLIPARTWSFGEMADYGERFFDSGGRKITLNLALVEDAPADPAVLQKYFDPEVFIIKITPVNPTYSLSESGFGSLYFSNPGLFKAIIERFRSAGYTVIESIGELAENEIGSNCGQYVTAMRKSMTAEL